VVGGLDSNKKTQLALSDSFLKLKAKWMNFFSPLCYRIQTHMSQSQKETSFSLDVLTSAALFYHGHVPQTDKGT
jgi:hypothetical protein